MYFANTMTNRVKQQTDSAMLDRARHLCALNEQCESGVRQKLIVWGADADTANSIVARLREENYLDDKRYARVYCESKLMGQGWGRQKVLYQLRLKHLPKDVIDNCLASIDEERYQATLFDLASRKRKEFSNLSDRDRDRKLASFLLSRGFTYGEINSVISKIIEQ